MTYFRYGAALLLSVVLCSGCTTLVQKSGELLEGSVFAEKTGAVYRSVDGSATELREVTRRDDRGELVITSGEYPGLKLYAVRGEGSAIYFTRLYFVSTHVNGWNEFTLELEGAGAFSGIRYIEDGRRNVLRVTTPVRGLIVSSGRIRFKDTRVTGEQALARLVNRRERITAIVEWMALFSAEQGSMPPGASGGAVPRESSAPGGIGKPRFSSVEEFELYWKPILFPELVPEKTRPARYSTENAEWSNGNGIAWNRRYTEIIFPEELRELRDTGALLRDWEESLSWVYLEYSMDILAGFFNGMEFHRNN